MQDYCGDVKTEELMRIGLTALDEIRRAEARTLYARNPHELMRALEVLDILCCAEMITHSCLARKASSRWFGFSRLDYPEQDPPEWRAWVTVRLEEDQIVTRKVPLDYYGSLEEGYERHQNAMGNRAAIGNNGDGA